MLPLPRSITLAALATSALSVATSNSQTINILPLGDSITESDTPGYRGYLYRQLIDAGMDVNFVGNASTEPELPDGVMLDPDHDGYGGYSIGPGPSSADDFTDERGNLFVNIDEWLANGNSATADVDIVLLMVGVNDHANIVARNRDPGYDLVNEGSRRMAGLIDKILTRRPEAAIIVSSILRGGNPDQDSLFNIGETNAINQQLPAVVADRASHAFFYDGRTLEGTGQTWEPTDFDPGDVIHPNVSGYEKLANFWFTSINDVIDRNLLPTAPFSESVVPTLDTVSPAPGATGVSTRARVVLEFSEHLVSDSGNIVLKNLSGGDDRILDVTDEDQVELLRWELILTPTVPLDPDTTYAIQVDEGALEDQFGNVFEGISGEDFSFTTNAVEEIVYANDFSNNSDGWSLVGAGGGNQMFVDGGAFAVEINQSAHYYYTDEAFTGNLIYSGRLFTANAERAGLKFNASGENEGYIAVYNRRGTGEFRYAMHKMTDAPGSQWFNFGLNGNGTLVDGSRTPYGTESGRNTTIDVRVRYNAATSTADVIFNGEEIYTDFVITDFLSGSIGFSTSFNSAGASIDDALIKNFFPDGLNGAFAYQAEDLARSTSGPIAIALPDPMASATELVEFDSTAIADVITVTMPDIPAGTYNLSVSYRSSSSSGILSVDEATGASLDQYSEATAYQTADMGSITQAADGDFPIAFELVGQNPASSGFATTIDSITLTSGGIIVPGPSNFNITLITRNQSTGDLTLNWDSEADASYDLQSSTDLQTWEDIDGQTGISSAGASTSATFQPAAEGRLYFRVRQL